MYEYRARCVKVVDGDTFDFDVDLGFHTTHRIRVRLKDVDTPELNSKVEAEREHAKEATEFVKTHLMTLGDSPWVVIRTEKDRLGIYGRYTATVEFSNGNDLGEMLKSAGFEKRASYE